MSIVVAPPGASLADRNRADVILSAREIVPGLARLVGTPDTDIELTAGFYDVNAGVTAAGNRYLTLAAGTTVTGAGPGRTRLEAESHPCRISIPEGADGVTLANFGGFGYVGIQGSADRLTCEDIFLTQSEIGGGGYVPFGNRGGCTAAFMIWGRRGRTVRDLVFRRCTADRSYHHGFSMNLAGAQEGGGFADVLFDQCHAIAAGSGLEGKNGIPGARDWSCGFDIPDAGDIARMIVRDCWAVNCWQDGFHIDGSWTGHRQQVIDVLFERCHAVGNGWRSGHKPTELYQSGFYVQSGHLVDCVSESNRKAGFLCKNDGGALVLDRCTDDGSAYGFVIEYGGGGAQMVRCVSSRATRRALQATATGAGIDLEIRNFAGPGAPVLVGITERLEYVDAPSHAADLARYRARGWPFSGALVLGVEQAATVDHLVDVHPPSVRLVDLSAAVVRVLPRPPDGAPPHPLAGVAA